MDLQTIIVVGVVLGACLYAGVMFVQRSRSFSVKAKCTSGDCGCGQAGGKKKIRT